MSQRVVRGPGELSKLSIEVHAGKLVAGRYRIGRVIGAGAMGTVVEAREVNLDRKVAIKFLKPDALGDANAVARFFVEARSAAQLASDHAVRVYGVDTLDDGAPYIVMEYLEGCDLAEWLSKKHKSTSVAQAVQFVLQACDALDEAHRRGIIHRDVKPANLFAVDREGGPPRIKVLDFGISKMEAIVSDTLPPERSGPAVVPTQRSAIFGSFPYMSPEQMESARSVDRRTDIWSLGVTLWELLSGEQPFRAGSLVALHSTIMSGVRPRLRALRPDVSPELESVLLRCLAPRREDRYETVQELIDALNGVPWTVEPTAVSSPGGKGTRRALSRGIRGAWWTLAGLVLAFVGSVLIVSRWRHAAPVPAPDPSAVVTVSMPSVSAAPVGPAPAASTVARPLPAAGQETDVKPAPRPHPKAATPMVARPPPPSVPASTSYAGYSPPSGPR
ncbi:MAG TPA: protein kinase [Polyangiaceae bacterium]